MKYIIIRADRAAEYCEVGETVYSYGCDYGLANDDTRATGMEHVSVSRVEGEPSSFTIPLVDLNAIP